MKTALAHTADNLRASIAAREAASDKTPDFVAVTNVEKARLAEVESALRAEKSSAPADKITPAQ